MTWRLAVKLPHDAWRDTPILAAPEAANSESSNHMVTLPSGRRLTVKNAAGLAGPGRWQRMQLIKGHGHEYDSGEARSSIARGARLTKPGWAQSRARGGWHAKLYRRDAG